MPEYVKARIRKAAALSGRAMSDFMIAAALEAAEELVEAVERWTLNEEQSRVVLQLLTDTRERPKLREFLKISDPEVTRVATHS
ncbi:MAG: DUF1778 domain-containing protein [Candidatus Eremiobacteraeota bacterium]|nr:DUF1778 domain-containing protein [Candidatus Eremiobacteraeota bacterium]